MVLPSGTGTEEIVEAVSHNKLSLHLACSRRIYERVYWIQKEKKKSVGVSFELDGATKPEFVIYRSCGRVTGEKRWTLA